MQKSILFFLIITWPCLSMSQMNMSLLGNWDPSSISGYNDVWGYVDQNGNEYGIIGTNAKIYFIDVTTPGSPQLVGEFAGGQSTSWRDMKTYKNFAYAVSDATNEGLMIFDLQDISSGVITKVHHSNAFFGSAHNIFIDVPQGRLYVIGSNSRSNGLIVLDISQDPANPTMLGSVGIPGGYVHDAFVINNIAYCSSGYDGLYIIDYTNPSFPQYVASINTGGYNHSGWILDDGEKFVFAEEIPTGRPLGLIDLTGAASDNLEIISTFKDPLDSTATNNVYHNPYILGDYAYVSSYEDGVTIFDISDSSQVTLAGYFDTHDNPNGYSGYNGCWGVYPYLPSGNILASDRQNGLFILSTTLTQPNLCGNGQQDPFENGVDCGGFCPPCEVVCGGDVSLDGIFSETHAFKASKSISATTFLAVESDVQMFAGDLVLFKPGFISEIGSSLTAGIGSCTPTSISQSTIPQISGTPHILTPSIERNADIRLTNYPNPFNAYTVIRVDLPERSTIQLSILAMDGSIVANLAEQEVRDHGMHEWKFSTEHLQAGMYVCLLQTDAEVTTRRLVLAR